MIAFWIRAKGSLKEKLAWLFDLYDIDKNGYITHYELYKTLKLLFAMKSINDEDPYEKAFEIMKMADRSRDGFLTRYEFINACMYNQNLQKLFAPY